MLEINKDIKEDIIKYITMIYLSERYGDVRGYGLYSLDIYSYGLGFVTIECCLSMIRMLHAQIKSLKSEHDFDYIDINKIIRARNYIKNITNAICNCILPLNYNLYKKDIQFAVQELTSISYISKYVTNNTIRNINNKLRLN